MSKSVCVIGGGFAGLSSACYLARAGFQVDRFEKNADIGGRARKIEAEGFTFDMGPGWYWMPDVTSFSIGIHMLHRSLHDAIYSIYGFVRVADEILDSFHDHDQANLLGQIQA